MFKTNKPTQIREGQVDTMIGPQVVIRGDLHFSGGLYIEGRVIGKLVAQDGQPASLTLAENGSIEGEVRAPIVVLNGELNGDVYASERVELAAKARVQGNVHYKVVEMTAGSMLTGRLIHVDAHAAALPSPEALITADALMD
ncbi:bactofilin family protein [Lysobacter antibioticus]|jgi:cytoskeletal protein CcmA (bactofilin family)|uniref:Polymer-forming cytoskeletal family protein n=1 Tax=Lysobacter antibioticus TaxID=84531 RepID=A0A0S2FFZ0_LYSAN|nr:polymer-forming cytoskeletal protein [Lysobacter antibioticus]ALN82451.1 polymer-forming cytoskeletal family protein [Lysobacter antibioticus]